MQRQRWWSGLVGVLLVGMVVLAAPTGAQDTESGALDWIVSIPRTDRATTDEIGFDVNEERGEVAAVLTVDGTVTFGGGEVPEATYGSGTHVVRMDLDGTLLGVITLSTAARDLSIAADGDLLVASGSGTVTRIAPDGAVRWERTVDGAFFRSVAELADGSIALAAEMRDTVTFGAGEPSERTVEGNGARLGSAVVAWFGGDGSFLTADPWPGVSDIALARGPASSVKVVGTATTPLTLGVGQPNETSIEVDESGEFIPRDTLVASYDGDRALEWVVATGVTYSGDTIDVAADDDGAAVIWLSIGAVGIAGAGLDTETEVGPLDRDAEFGDDHVLARYRADGDLDWIHVIGSVEAGEEEYRSLGVQGSGGIIALGDIGPGDTVIDGPDDLIVAMGETTGALVGAFAVDGSLAWATAFSSDTFDVGWGAAMLEDGDVIILGLTGGPTSFGFPGDEVSVSEDQIWFVARIDGLEPPPPTTTTTTTTTLPDEEPPADDVPPEPEPEPEPAPEPEPDDEDDSGAGGTIAVVLAIVVVLGGAGVVLARRRAG